MSIDNLSQLKALKLFGMATALAEIRAETSRLTLTPDGCLNRLIDAELADRQARKSHFEQSINTAHPGGRQSALWRIKKTSSRQSRGHADIIIKIADVRMRGSRCPYRKTSLPCWHGRAG
jgi:hypothetical protein